MTDLLTIQRPDPFRLGDTFDPALVRWVLDGVVIAELMAAIGTATEVVYDLETTGLNPHETGRRRAWPVPARIALASLTLPQPDEAGDPWTWVVPLSHPQGPWAGVWRQLWAQITGAVQRSGAPVTNQNLGFDDRWTEAATHVDLTHQFAWDTQIGSHMLDENDSTKLKERAPEVFHVKRWDDHDLSTPGASERVPLFDLGLYAARDTYWTWRLAVYQRTVMNVGEEGENGPPDDPEQDADWRLGTLASWCAMPMGASLTRISANGFQLDHAWVNEHAIELGQVCEEELSWLVELYDRSGIEELEGVPSFAPTSKWFLAWADLAVAAGDLRIAAFTDRGKPQWSKAVLMRQSAAGSEVATRLLRFRAADKQRQFLAGWLDAMSDDGAIHATYHAGRVVTGRLSSSDPNMQQVTKSLKPAFVARPGFLIADLDYSQIELRVAAFISRCEPMLEAYRKGEDLHRLTASQVAGCPLDLVTTSQRQRAKPVNFGFLYGMGANGFREYALTSYGITYSDQEAEATRRAFFDAYPELTAWHARSIANAQRYGQVVSPIGRIRRLPAIDSTNDYLSSSAERQAINSPVQGFASDLMQIAAASIQGYLPGYSPVPDVRVVATVHDSIVIEVPEDDWQRATARCMRRMLDLDPILRRLGCYLDVPLGVDATVGTRWGLADIGTIS